MFNRRDKARIAELEAQLEMADKLIRGHATINRCIDVQMSGRNVMMTFVCNGEMFDIKFPVMWDFDLNDTRMRLGLVAL